VLNIIILVKVVETQKDIERHFIDVCLKYKEELLFIL